MACPVGKFTDRGSSLPSVCMCSIPVRAGLGQHNRRSRIPEGFHPVWNPSFKKIFVRSDVASESYIAKSCGPLVRGICLVDARPVLYSA